MDICAHQLNLYLWKWQEIRISKPIRRLDLQKLNFGVITYYTIAKIKPIAQFKSSDVLELIATFLVTPYDISL
jgi:hypothetical protein